MTRNVYLGADIDRPLLSAVAASSPASSPGLSPASSPASTPEETLVALGNATQLTRSVVDRTDFRVRAGLLAREIDRTRPDLIGLQEVALWRHGPLQLDQVGVPNASVVDYDYLQILLEALDGTYEPVCVGDRADVESPSFSGGVIDRADGCDVRLTMRDVILVRTGGDVEVVDSGDRLYSRNLAVEILGTSLTFDRGWQWVDIESGTSRFRFVNTHLEAVSSDIALSQAEELLSTTPSPAVIVGDFNSDPLDDTIKPRDSVPHKAPHELLSRVCTDAWLRFGPASSGWTAGLSETVDDPTPAGFDHRIDMIFFRDADDAVTVTGGAVTGTHPDDRDPRTGLWPSDHGGVALTLKGL